MKKIYLIIFSVIALSCFGISEVYATHLPDNIIKVEGTITAGVQNFDFILPDTIIEINKTAVFMTFRHIGDSNEKEVYRSWEIINSTAIRFYGSSNVPANNDAVSFVGYILEYPSGDMFSQQNSFTIAGGLSNQEFDDIFDTAVNTTSSFFQYMGQTANMGDLSWGREELARMRIINSTGFGYEPTDAPNSGDTIVRYQIIDLDDPNVLVQRGVVSMPEGTELVTVTPPTAINGSRTMLFASHNTNGELDADADEAVYTARINSSNDLEFDRDDALCGTPLCDLSIRWETITFLDGSVYVQYLQFDDATATGANVQQTGTVNFASTPVNFTRSIATGTVHTPFGLGQARTASAPTGGFDRLAYTVELIDTDTVDVVTNDGSSLADIWFQVIEFAESDAGQTFNQTITDTTTVNENIDFDINKTAVDFSSAVDMETQATINFTGTDVVQAIDVINITSIFVVNLNDNGTTTDIVHFNVTKLIQDMVMVGDIASINGTANVTSSILDAILIVDQPTFNVTKLLSDISSVADTTIVTRTRNVSLLDNVTANDMIILNITKQVSDTAIVTDTIDITRIRNLLLNDTATVNDPSIFFTINTLLPNGTGTGSGGSGGAGIPTFQRIVGLNIISELFHVKPNDRVPSDFIIQTFGREDSETSIVSIEPSQEFITWFQFSSFPDPLNFDTTVDSSRTINDPARFKNVGLDDFVLTVPQISCDELDPFVTPVPCIDQIIYEAPLIFTFKKDGVEFKEKHIVTIDASTPIVCDPICQFVAFMTANYWWLAGILIMFIILYFVAGTVRRRGIRTVSRVNASHFRSFSADTKPRKKFKRGKR